MQTLQEYKQERKNLGRRHKTYTKWLNRVRDTKTMWTENEIRYFRKAINSTSSLDMDYRIALRLEFTDRTDAGVRYKITPEQSEKGRMYLLTKSLKKNGQTRSTNKLGKFELDVLRNLKTHFFIGLYNYNPYSQQYLPIYRALAKNGAYFDYLGTTYDQMEIVSVGGIYV